METAMADAPELKTRVKSFFDPAGAFCASSAPSQLNMSQLQLQRLSEARRAGNETPDRYDAWKPT